MLCRPCRPCFLLFGGDFSRRSARLLHAKPMSKLSQADLVHQATYEHTKHGLGAPPALTDIAVNLADAAFKVRDLPPRLLPDRRSSPPDKGHYLSQGHVTEVCSRARDAGVKTIIVSGTSVQSSRLSQQLVEEHSPTFDLYFTAGVHPHTAKVVCLHCRDRPLKAPLLQLLVTRSLRMAVWLLCSRHATRTHCLSWSSSLSTLAAWP